MTRPQRRLPAPRAMIVAPQPEAVEVGAAVLRNGGNAADALVAAALTQGVVDPMMCGIGGLGVLQILDPATGRHEVIDGLSTCPAGAHEAMWANAFLRECADGYGYQLEGYVNEFGHASVTTPGILRVLGIAHADYGSRDWAELCAPAAAVAAEGWMVRPHVHTMMTMDESPYGRLGYAAKLASTPDGAALYLRPDGTPKKPGEVIRNTGLAETLGIIAREGAEAFYTGSIAARIIADMQARGGLLSAEDLAAYTPVRGKPLMVDYRGRGIAMPQPPAGGLVVGQMLKLLERFDLVALGHNSADYIRILSEAMLIAGIDKEAFMGDPRFTEIPADRLLSDAYAGECAARIRAGERAILKRASNDKGTTTLTVVDARGMVATLTHTLGLPSGVIPPGSGFVLNGAMNWYDPRPGRPGSIAPGKKRYSSMTPTIVLEDGQAVAALGSPGGAWITVAILQVLVNLLDWGMTMQEAVQAPRFSATSEVIDIGNRIPRGTQRALEAQGYQVRRYPQTFPFAAPHGITMWDGNLEGGADPQRDGYAAGV